LLVTLNALNLQAHQSLYLLVDGSYTPAVFFCTGDLAGYVQPKYERVKITFAPGNAFETDFRSRFDEVLISEVFEHVTHPDEFLE
jgi:hypothetical protein